MATFFEQINERRLAWPLGKDQPMDAFAYYAFDALWAAAVALDATEKELQSRYGGSKSLTDFNFADSEMAEIIKQKLVELEFWGATGLIKFLPNGDRLGPARILQFQSTEEKPNGEFVHVGLYTEYNDETELFSDFVWITPDGKAPKDKVKEIPLLQRPLIRGLIALAVIIGIAVPLGIVLLVYYVRKMQFETEIASLQWQISEEDLNVKKQEKSFLGTLASLGSLGSLGNKPISNETLPFCQGKWKDRNVSLFALTEAGRLDVNKSVLVRLKTLRDLSFHENVARFYGVCLGTNNAIKKYIVSEYAAKGAVVELIENEQFQLDWPFKFSIIKDIATGMLAIHESEIEYHGFLTDKNCVIDSKFVTKVSDFGLPMFRRPTANIDYSEELLFTAPECLQKTPKGISISNPSKKGDVFSFAIISYEILTRQIPFQDEIDNDIVDKVLQEVMNTSSEIPRRPKSSMGEDIPKSMVELVTKCWSDSAETRPEFKQIVKNLAEISRKNKMSANILENLLNRMEQYGKGKNGYYAKEGLQGISVVAKIFRKWGKGRLQIYLEKGFLCEVLNGTSQKKKSGGVKSGLYGG